MTDEKKASPFTAQEMALIFTFAYTTMEVVAEHPDRLEEMLQPENGLTKELFEQVLGKLTMMRVIAQVAQSLGVTVPEDEADDTGDLASMKPAGNA